MFLNRILYHHLMMMCTSAVWSIFPVVLVLIRNSNSKNVVPRDPSLSLLFIPLISILFRFLSKSVGLFFPLSLSFLVCDG
jgi:hypothetical protein